MCIDAWIDPCVHVHALSFFFFLSMTFAFYCLVYADGRVCISILHAPGDDPNMYESSSERWSPVQSVEKILLSVISMLAGTFLMMMMTTTTFFLFSPFCTLTLLLLLVACHVEPNDESGANIEACVRRGSSCS